jgi:hypothetical protein
MEQRAMCAPRRDERAVVELGFDRVADCLSRNQRNGQVRPHCELLSCTANLPKSRYNCFKQVILGELVLLGAVRKANLKYAGQSTSGTMHTINFGAGSTSSLEEDARVISFVYETAGVKEKTWHGRSKARSPSETRPRCGVSRSANGPWASLRRFWAGCISPSARSLASPVESRGLLRDWVFARRYMEEMRLMMWVSGWRRTIGCNSLLEAWKGKE